MLRPLMFCILMLFGATSPAGAVHRVLEGAALRGEATLHVIGLPVYQARLFTPGGERFDWNTDFAIEITYLRDLSRSDLVDVTMKEFERLGDPLPLRAQLGQCLSDVREGDRYAAISRGPNQVIFLYNDMQTCTLTHPMIKRRLMEIFVGDNTRSPQASRLLRGE